MSAEDWYLNDYEYGDVEYGDVNDDIPAPMQPKADTMNDRINEVLDEIRAEIEKTPSELTADGRRMIRRGSVFRILDKYRESEGKE